MPPASAPPALAAVMAPSLPRDRRLKICLRPAEHEALAAFAQQANTKPATLAGALVRASLRRLADEQAQAILAAQEAA